MHRLHEDFNAISLQIERLADHLYAHPRPGNIVDLAEIIRGLPDLDGQTVDRLLQRLDARGIIEFDDRRQTIRLVPDGRLFQQQRCVPEVVLGLNYSDRKFAEAVVRIVIRKVDGEQGAGSGFFIAEPPDHIITNRHVALNEIVQVEGPENQVFSTGDLPKILGPESLDLAAIECQTPVGVAPIRIDWNPETARTSDQVLVLGYPYVANHQPALLHAQGTINMVAKRIGAELRTSLIISDAAARGCSGGPVLNLTGMAVGIVAREEEAQAEGVGPLRFLSAIPSYYLQEFMPR